MSQHRIAIFVSGTGSNARVMIDAFAEETDLDVVLVVSSTPDARALVMAAERQVPTLVLEKKVFRETSELLTTLAEFSVDFIVLAG
ncbi:MAG: formyltransferase family protein, partial [Bacteroidota bacterium]